MIFIPDVRLTDWSRPEVTDILARDLCVTVRFATDILREGAQSVTGGVIVTEIVQSFNELYQRSSNHGAWFNELLVTCRLE